MTGKVEETTLDRSHGKTLVLVTATALGIYVCCRLVAPFLAPLTWALSLAVVFLPVHRKLESKAKHPSVAASASILLIGLIVVVPLVFVGQRLVQEAVTGAGTLKERVDSGEWRKGLEAHPKLGRVVGWIERQIDVPGALEPFTAWVTRSAPNLVKRSAVEAIQLVLTFYFLFYLLRDRESALRSIRSLSPLSHAEMDRLFTRVGDTIHATVFGTLAMAAVQGLLGGLMFWWLGLEAPLLWGVVMGILAVVPVLGAFLVWIPAAAGLALQGAPGKALILVVWGSLVVGGIDNLLYPVLVGTRLKLHTILAFVAMVGGLVVLGASGLILGPVALTTTQLLLEFWRARTADPAAESG